MPITRLYTYSQIKGASTSLPCRVATTGNITLSGLQTIDGVSLSAGDRVLVKNQGTASDNGIYVVASGSWSRAVDMSIEDDVYSGITIYVNQGSTNGGKYWRISTAAPVTLSNLSFSANAGLYGTSGTAGTSGTSGTSGSSGSSGTAGTRGSSGSSGTAGTSGSSGTSGTSGTSGSSGTSGTSGTAGTNGVSATSGVSGTSGSSGTSGTSGTTGNAGTNRVSGTSGTSGTSGAPGPTGFQGIQGAAGPLGPQGLTGPQGVAGPLGFQGPAGVQGPRGPQGFPGFQPGPGPQGPIGPPGAAGPTGFQGTPGAPGPLGDTGPQGSGQASSILAGTINGLALFGGPGGASTTSGYIYSVTSGGSPVTPGIGINQTTISPWVGTRMFPVEGGSPQQSAFFPDGTGNYVWMACNTYFNNVPPSVWGFRVGSWGGSILQVFAQTSGDTGGISWWYSSTISTGANTNLPGYVQGFVAFQTSIRFPQYTSNGTVSTSGSNGTLTVTSSADLKIFDGYIEDGLGMLNRMLPRYYYWRDQETNGDRRQLGFYAQELSEISEEISKKPLDEDGMWAIEDRAVIAVITKANQELEAKIAILKEKLKNLKDRI